jgi:hypothetical protein
MQVAVPCEHRNVETNKLCSFLVFVEKHLKSSEGFMMTMKAALFWYTTPCSLSRK